MRETRKTIWSQEIAVAMGLAMLLGITGCAGDGEAQDQMWEDASSADGGSGDTQDGGGDADIPKTQKAKWEREEPVFAKETDSSENGAGKTDGTEKGGDSADASALATGDGAEEPKGQADGGRTLRSLEGTEHLGGKIQKLQADGMTFAHTSLVDENGSVTLLDMKDAEKIQVKYTEDTRVEHWIIQGGGAGIDMQDAAFSDLQEGMGVELEGYFDGETFVATKVIMEDYE